MAMAAVGWQGAALRTLRERNRGNAAFEVLVNSCTLLALIGLPSVPVLVVPPSASLLAPVGVGSKPTASPMQVFQSSPHPMPPWCPRCLPLCIIGAHVNMHMWTG